MPATWLDDSATTAERRFRSAWLLSLLSGLVQKPLVRMAWDIEVTVLKLAALRSVCEAPGVLGMTLILLRQVYAQKAQEMVGDMSLDVAKGLGHVWTRRALQKLAEVLGGMDKQDSRKDTGRMRNYTGPAWVHLVADDPAHYKAFCAAGLRLGRSLLASADAEAETFASLFKDLTTAPAKLPGVGTYSVAGILRALCAVQASVGLPTLVLTEADWVKHLRDMTDDTTKVAFQQVGVRALADAEAMVAVIRAVCSKYWGFRQAALWRRVDVLDLSCQACEFLQVLRAVRRARPEEASSFEEAAAWLLRHLPQDAAGIRAMGKSLRLARQRVPGRGNGRDLQSGFNVATGWLQQRDSGAAPAGPLGEGDASGVLEQFLPQSRCESCSSPLRPPFRACEVCARERRRVYMRTYRTEGPVAKRRRAACKEGIAGRDTPVQLHTASRRARAFSGEEAPRLDEGLWSGSFDSCMPVPVRDSRYQTIGWGRADADKKTIR